MKRRTFIQNSALGGLGIVAGANEMTATQVREEQPMTLPGSVTPVVVATWNVPASVQTAYELLSQGGSALDAIEQGCRVEEANAEGQSVGLGGLPDREGQVTLDACIMTISL